MQISRNKGMPQIPKWEVDITALSLVKGSRGSAHAVQAEMGVLPVLLLRYPTTEVDKGRMIRSMVSLLTRVYGMF